MRQLFNGSCHCVSDPVGVYLGRGQKSELPPGAGYEAVTLTSTLQLSYKCAVRAFGKELSLPSPRSPSSQLALSGPLCKIIKQTNAIEKGGLWTECCQPWNDQS